MTEKGNVEIPAHVEITAQKAYTDDIRKKGEAAMSFGTELLELRESRGLTQAELAHVLDISRTTLGEIEKGKRDITLGELRALARYLDMELVDILTGDSLMESSSTLSKYEEMILQIAQSFHTKTGKDIPKTFLAKLVYLVDFSWFYEHLESMSGMSYVRREHGPVANEYFTALGKIIDEGKFTMKRGRTAQLYATTFSEDEPFISQYLSVQEIDLIDRIVEKWKSSTTQEIVAFTHSQLPWQICTPNEVIPYLLITQEEPDHVF